MRIVSFHSSESPASSRPSLGALLPGDREILDFCAEASGVPQPGAHLAWFTREGASFRAARELHDAVLADDAKAGELRGAGAIVAVEGVKLAAPVPRPGKLLCIGLNYKDHAAESGMDIPERPLVFSKFPTCVIGPQDPVRIPLDCHELDYEAEFAIVIGKRASRVARQDAMEHVLGYCCVNDISARDFQFADGQWQRGKSCDTFAPMGPFVATPDEIGDPHALRIQFRRNGETLQDSNTDQLVFGVESLIAEISRHITLEAGDVISTGTPPGVGFARKPPVWLQDGDAMEVEIEGLGVLRNPVQKAEA